MQIISVVNQKGGVSKTTTTVNLAAAMAKKGKRVLVIDLDPQRNATTALNTGAQYEGFGINELIYFAVGKLPFSLQDYIQRSEAERVDYIPATPMLASAPNTLAQDKDSWTVLRRLLRCPELEGSYDFVLADCKPSLDLLVSNALVASDRIIVPVMPESFALDGLGDLLDTIEGVRARYNDQLRLDGILISRANLARKVARQLISELRETFGSLVYQTILRDLSDCAKAQEMGRSAVNCKGNALGALYEKFAEEVLRK